MTRVVFFDIGDTLVSGQQWLPGAKEAVVALKSMKIRVGLISNTGRLSREELVEGFLPDDFDFGMFDEDLVMLSSEVGIEKPSLSIFMLAAQHANVSPWEVLFVAETVSETLAAQSAGIHAVRVTDPAKDYPQLVKLLQSRK